MEINEVIDQLISKGAEIQKNVRINSINTDDMGNYVRVSLGLKDKIKGMEQKDGEYVEGYSKVLFASTFSISALFKNTDNCSFAASHIIDNPNSLKVLLDGATIDIVQIKVNKGDVWENPFSDTPKPETVVNDTYYNYITNIKFSDMGKESLRELRKYILFGNN